MAPGNIMLKKSGFALDHEDLVNMPDLLGVNPDHDARYLNLSGENGNQEYIDWALSPTIPTEPEGRQWWNPDFFTLNVATGLGPVNQLGQETWKIIYNNTGDEIKNGKAIRLTGIADVGGVNYPTIDLAKADTHVDIRGAIFITTMDIPNDSIGICTKFGRVQGLDTTGFTPGPLWISATTAGELTSTRPSFPSYAYNVGAVESIANPGVIDTDVVSAISDTFDNFWNGTFRESFDFMVDSDGATVTGTLTPSNGHLDMTMIFSDGLSILDTTPGATITLTPASDDEIPITNYVYIPESTKVLTVATDSWPTTIEHIRVAQVFLQTAATTQSEGALRNQNWNDEIEDTDTFQGHLSHIGAKLRQFEAQWDTGCEGSVVIGPADEVWIKNTSGTVLQMHEHTYPAQDMTQYVIDAVDQGLKTFTISGDGDLSTTFTDGKLITVHDSTGNDGIYTVVSTLWSDPDFIITVEETIPSAVADGTIGDDIHIVNSDNGAYTETIDLGTELNDASGNPLLNTSFSVVVWGVINKSGQPQHLMANMPISTYNKNFPEQAVTDADAASVYTIPKAFQGVGFLIARFTFVNTSGVWSLYATQDLRGFLPNTTAGAGAGASGITTYLGLTDTDSTYVAQAGKFPQVNVGETALTFFDLFGTENTWSANQIFSTINGGTLSGNNSGDQDLSTYVVGPASATDNAIARYNLTTGKLIQNSGVTIDDSNNLTTTGSVNATSFTGGGSAIVGLKLEGDQANGLEIGPDGGSAVFSVKYGGKTLIDWSGDTGYPFTVDANTGGDGAANFIGNVDIVGDVEVGSTNAFYWGDKTTDSSWRQIRSGNDLRTERRESGVWVDKGGYTAS